MLQNTAFFLFVLGVLSMATGVSIWHLTSSSASPEPSVRSAIDIGLPNALRPPNSRTVDASAAIIWEADTRRILFEQNAFERRPIASLTKLMTAIVAIDRGVDWDQRTTINLNEYGLGGNLLLHAGEEVTMRDLFAASLLGSANNATKAYVRMLGLKPEEFVQEMNRKAIELGLEQTSFTDVTGLDNDNISTAYEVARLAEIAFTQYPEIAKLSAQPEYAFTVLNSNREHIIKNTNKQISEGGVVMSGSKTGYLDEARYCLVGKGVDKAQNRIVVVLGSPSQEINEATVLSLLQRVFP